MIIRSITKPTIRAHCILNHIAGTMSFARPYSYIQDYQLARLWKDKASSSSVAIVDVRDDDFEGGNIPGCLHIPSTEFPEKVNELVKGPLKDSETLCRFARSTSTDHLDFSESQVVFHCSLSQAR